MSSTISDARVAALNSYTAELRYEDLLPATIHETKRKLYALEELWGDAPVVK